MLLDCSSVIEFIINRPTSLTFVCHDNDMLEMRPKDE